MSLNPRGRLNWWMGAVASVSLLGGCGAPDEHAGRRLRSNEHRAGRGRGRGGGEAVRGEASSLSARDDVLVTVTMTNVSSPPVRLLKWNTPVDGLKEDLFKVTRDGVSAEYIGRHYKWAAPQADGLHHPGAGRERVAHGGPVGRLCLPRPAATTIRYAAASARRRVAAALQQPDRVDRGPSPSSAPRPRPPGHRQRLALSTANCTSTRVTSDHHGVQLREDLREQRGELPERHARRHHALHHLVRHLHAAPAGPPCKTHFTSIKSAFDTKAVIVDCGCTDSAYAYVYPNSPYRIYVCNAFWSAPNTGTDSKAGTLIHEMSHFNVVAGTDDCAYGQSARQEPGDLQPHQRPATTRTATSTSPRTPRRCRNLTAR